MGWGGVEGIGYSLLWVNLRRIWSLTYWRLSQSFQGLLNSAPRLWTRECHDDPPDRHSDDQPTRDEGWTVSSTVWRGKTHPSFLSADIDSPPPNATSNWKLFPENYPKRLKRTSCNWSSNVFVLNIISKHIQHIPYIFVKVWRGRVITLICKRRRLQETCSGRSDKPIRRLTCVTKLHRISYAKMFKLQHLYSGTYRVRFVFGQHCLKGIQ